MGDKKELIFDIRASENYDVVEGKCKSGKFELLSTSCSSQALPVNHSINIDGKESDPIEFAQVSIDNLASLQVQRGIGLQIPTNELDQYFQNRLSKTFRTRTQSFSFLFSDSINKLFIGERQNYLADSFVSFPVLHSANNNRWILNIKQFSQEGQSSHFAISGSTVVQFDSTTSKILVPAPVLNDMEKTIDSLSTISNKDKCLLIKDKNHILSFVFDKDGDYQNNKFLVKLNDLIQVQEDKTCILLLEKTNIDHDYEWVLGTTFMKNVYTYFNYDDHTIQLGNANEVVVAPITADSTWTPILIITGILIGLATLGILLALIKPIDSVPSPAKNQMKSNVAPQYLPQQQQRFVVYQQPYSQSMPPQFRQSPQRVNISQPPQSQIFGQQTILRQ